jgi:hypothetical protein
MSSRKTLAQIDTILREKTNCSIRRSNSIDVQEARMLRSSYIAIVIGDEFVCFADNLFNRLFFVCLSHEAFVRAEETAMGLFAQGYPLIPERSYVIQDCTGTPTTEDLACFAAVIVRECLANNGTPASVMRCPGFSFEILALCAGKAKDRFMKKFEELPEVGIELECFEKYFRYNQAHEFEWNLYAQTVFNTEVKTSPWGLTLTKYDVFMANLQGAFGLSCVRNFAFLFSLLQGYSILPLEEFKVKFQKESLIKIEFEGDDAKFYHRLVQAAYVAGRTTGGPYLMDSLIGLHDYSISAEFKRHPNILLSPPPFELFLPIYWYTVRKFLLTNTSP